jgi:hypothetical protein
MFGVTLADCAASVWLICYSEVLPPSAAELLSRTRASQDAEDRRARAETMPDATSFAYRTVEDDGGRFYLEVRSPSGLS